MKKPILAMAMLALLCMGVAASAAVTTITFDSTQMVASATTNTGAPAAGDGRVYGVGWDVATYYNNTQTTAFNAWLSSLDSEEGISAFNLNLHQGEAAAWGENLWITDYTKPITAAGPAGWNTYVVDNPNGTKSISYQTFDPTKYIRPGNDIGTFMFSAETNGVFGGSYVIWVGAGPVGVKDTGSPSATDFQRAITAQAVPEPSSLLVLLSGVGGLGSLIAFRRRRA